MPCLVRACVAMASDIEDWRWIDCDTGGSVHAQCDNSWIRVGSDSVWNKRQKFACDLPRDWRRVSIDDIESNNASGPLPCVPTLDLSLAKFQAFVVRKTASLQDTCVTKYQLNGKDMSRIDKFSVGDRGFSFVCVL